MGLEAVLMIFDRGAQRSGDKEDATQHEEMVDPDLPMQPRILMKRSRMKKDHSELAESFEVATSSFEFEFEGTPAKENGANAHAGFGGESGSNALPNVGIP